MKEKLIELLCESDKAIIDEARPMTLEEREEKFLDGGYAFHADFLIANGVTVREKGEWKDCDWVEYDGFECNHYPHEGRVCTNCRNAFKKEFINNPRVNFCPHCGAKMDGDT